MKKEIKTVLVVLLIALLSSSLYLMSNLLAKYQTSKSGSDSARVAKFEITETQGESQTQYLDCTLSPGKTYSYPVTITNSSEVTIEYKIECKNLYNNLPLNFTIKDSNNNQKIDNLQTIDMGNTQTFNINIEWPSDKNAYDYMGKVDVVEVKLIAMQKD